MHFVSLTNFRLPLQSYQTYFRSSSVKDMSFWPLRINIADRNSAPADPKNNINTREQHSVYAFRKYIRTIKYLNQITFDLYVVYDYKNPPGV